MTPQDQAGSQRPRVESLSRRELLAYTAAFGGAFVAAQGLAAEGPDGGAQEAPKAALADLQKACPPLLRQVVAAAQRAGR